MRVRFSESYQLRPQLQIASNVINSNMRYFVKISHEYEKNFKSFLRQDMVVSPFGKHLMCNG